MPFPGEFCGKGLFPSLTPLIRQTSIWHHGYECNPDSKNSGYACAHNANNKVQKFSN